LACKVGKIIVTRFQRCFFLARCILEVHQEKGQNQERSSYTGGNVLSDFGALF
jgi:ABC-type sulfate transport system permease subunit